MLKNDYKIIISIAWMDRNNMAWICNKCGHANLDNWQKCKNCENPKPVF